MTLNFNYSNLVCPLTDQDPIKLCCSNAWCFVLPILKCVKCLHWGIQVDNNTSVKDCVIIFTFQMELKKQVNLSNQQCIRTLYFLLPRPTKKLFSFKQKSYDPQWFLCKNFWNFCIDVVMLTLKLQWKTQL